MLIVIVVMRKMALKFHVTDTDTDILADFRARRKLAGSRRVRRTRTTILADFTDTRAFPREFVH